MSISFESLPDDIFSHCLLLASERNPSMLLNWTEIDRNWRRVIWDYCIPRISHLDLSLGKLRCENEYPIKKLIQEAGQLSLDINFMANFRTVSDSLLESISLCNHITALDLSYCTNFTPKSLMNFKSLKYLKIHCCSQITDHNIDNFASCFEILELLDLTSCHDIGDRTMQILSTRSKRLKTLVLKHCELLTDRGIEYLSQGDTRETLENLDISFCLVGDYGISLLRKFPRMRSVIVAERLHNLWNCGNWNEQSLKALNDSRPDIKISFRH